MRLTTLIATGLVALAAALPATAQQGLFAPRMIINDRAITNYEVEQRRIFLKLLRAPGDLEKLALEQLVDDRLRMLGADAAGMKATPEQIEAGMEEFASRANLSTEEFLKEISAEGVAPQTYRDFVEAGLVWREVVRAKFAPRTRITEAEIDRAFALTSQRGDLRVLLSELIIPAPPGQEASAMELAQRLQQEVKGEAAFADAARTYSGAVSAQQGGRLDWLPLSNLPPNVAPLLLPLAPGSVSDPVPIPNGVVLFFLRAIEETGLPKDMRISVDYAQFLIPDDARAAEEAARIRNLVDNCGDLYAVAKGLPEDRLIRETRPMAEVPKDIALELARLDEGESSTALVHGGARVFLMLCARTPQISEPPSREAIRDQLMNQRLAALAEGYLEELRSNAIIREP